MARPQNPVDVSVAPELAQLCLELRQRREAAGITYRQMAEKVNYVHSRLSNAASGKELPSWDITRAYLIACGELDPDSWRPRWDAAAQAVKATRQAAKTAPPSGSNGSSASYSAAAMSLSPEAHVAASRAFNSQLSGMLRGLSRGESSEVDRLLLQHGQLPMRLVAGTDQDSVSRFLHDVRTSVKYTSKRAQRELSSRTHLPTSLIGDALTGTRLPAWELLNKLLMAAELEAGELPRYKARWDQLCIRENEVQHPGSLVQVKSRRPSTSGLEILALAMRSQEAARRLAVLLVAAGMTIALVILVVAYAVKLIDPAGHSALVSGLGLSGGAAIAQAGTVARRWRKRGS